MTLRIIAVGSLKEAYFRDAAAEYQKRLSRFCTLECLETPEERLTGDSEAARAAVRKKEGERLLQKAGSDRIIALDMRGDPLTSEAFAKRLHTVAGQAGSRIALLIGGSLGFSGEVRRRADFCLSFSNMTFPHQLMRVILLEQLYRAFTILEGHPYHK